MITVEEKIKLFEEVGLNRQADALRERIEMEREAKQMASMNFPRITFEQIKKKLSMKYLDTERYRNSEWRVAGVVLFWLGLLGSLVTVAVTLCCGSLKYDWYFPVVVLAIAGVFGFLGSFAAKFSCTFDASIKHMPIGRWGSTLPYGAGLALCEAKTAGLKAFEIFYPAKREEPMKADPVIVGYRHTAELCEPYEANKRIVGDGQMYEVFAWDDSKVYE